MSPNRNKNKIWQFNFLDLPICKKDLNQEIRGKKKKKKKWYLYTVIDLMWHN